MARKERGEIELKNPPQKFSAAEVFQGLITRRAYKSLLDQRVNCGVSNFITAYRDSKPIRVISSSRTPVRRHGHGHCSRCTRSERQAGRAYGVADTTATRADRNTECLCASSEIGKRKDEAVRLAGAGRHSSKADADRIERYHGID